MGNIVELNQYDEHVYQLEEEDDVLGGDTGPSNYQAHNLSNRTLWLKQQLENLQANSLLSGTVALKNKKIISGAVFTPGDGCYYDENRGVWLVDISSVASITKNAFLIGGNLVDIAAAEFPVGSHLPPEGGDPATFYVYFQKVDGDWELMVEGYDGYANAPETILLYTFTLVYDGANQTYPGLLSWTDERGTLTEFPYFTWINVDNEEAVVLPEGAVSDANYAVALDLISASDPDFVGTMRVTDRTTSGFNIVISGQADEVVIRWTLIKIA